LLKLLTALPPDRVGVYRQLQLGNTLKPVGKSYIVDLSEPGTHKTSAIFGPSRTTVPESVATYIKMLIELDRLQPGEYLFHSCERRTPLSSSAWTRHVQRAFKRYSGIAFAPKDCRASFITWLRDGEHGDETLRAAANAMRHSSTTQASAAYDKHGSDRVVAAAVAVAEAFAKKYSL
jgi:integrase